MMKLRKNLYTVLFGVLVFSCSAESSNPSPKTQWNENWFPNTSLTNQDGKVLKFYDDMIKGKVVAINFIFTSCPESCPLETAKLLEVYKELGDQVGRDVFFYSISVDPENDTPPVLKKYMQKFGVGPGWNFLTGNKKEIDQLRTKLGLLNPNVKEEKLADHNLTFIIGNEATGQWMKRSPMDNPQILASLLKNDLQQFKKKDKNFRSYASTVKMPEMSKGESLFTSRCASCHTLGGGESIGPDLRGIVNIRDKVWLHNWIKNPDKMLKEKDPLAISLYVKYKEVAMPNLKLNDSDVEALLKYLENK